ncbi:hypothetical protein PAG51_21350 [Klebsiella pneumoniae]|nr:hypothetical protein [Klebsiella pneumoniae]MDR4657604.1 hypothetical protein [Klebsiella pneumoniae]
MTNNQLAENSVIQLLNSVKLARDNAERADNRVDHSFYYALTIALEELQERRKAAMDSEPVAEVVSIYGDPEAFGEREIRPLVGIQQMPYGTKLYRHPQPAPVVPEEKPIPNTLSMYAVDAVAAIAEVKGWNACRAAMLQAGTITNEGTKQAWTGIPDIDNAINMLDRIDTLESCDDDRVEAVKTVLRRLAGNSPVIPDGYVMVPKVPSQAHLNSIAMRYRHDFYLLNDAQKDSALATARQMYEECSGQGFYTLPAAPQEGK